MRKELVFLALWAAAPAVFGANRYGDNVLQYGARDSDFTADYVSLLQKDLEKIGYGPYLLKSGKLEAMYGPATEEAVKEFQRNYGLAVTGIVNAETAAALERVLAGELPPPGNVTVRIALEDEYDLVIKRGAGVGRVKFSPQPGVTYVISGEGECQNCEVITPFGAPAPTAVPTPDVAAALAAAGDEAKAVVFTDGKIPGSYYIEVEPINDLKDIAIKIRVYRLSREEKKTTEETGGSE